MSYIKPNYNKDEAVEFYSSPSIQQGEELEQGYTAEILKILQEENICEYLGEEKLSKISVKLNEDIEDDRLSMDGYLKKYKRAIRLAKMQPENMAKNFPFEGASNLVMPYVIDAALQFNAMAMPMLLTKQDVCKIKVNGLDPDGSKEARGERVSEVVNQDLTSGIEGWRDEQDKALLLLPIVGTYFKKTWQCPYENKRKSQLIYPDDLIFDHSCSTFDKTPRKSFEYRMSKNEVIGAVRSKEFVNIDVDYYKDEETIEFIESHCWLDLDDDGYKEPYIVNIEKNGGEKIVSIVPRFDFDDVMLNEDQEVARIYEEKFFTQTIFIPDPTGSCMGLGFGILLGDMFEAINTHINQLTDAGTLQNISANSGFYRQGMRLGGNASRAKKGSIQMKMGSFSALEVSGEGSLAQNIVQMPFVGPSQALFNLLESMKNEVRQMTSATNMLEPMANEAAEMYLARLSEAMRGTNAIMIRVFSGVTKEIERIYEIMSRYLGQGAYQQLTGDENANWAADFGDDVQISLTADPSQGSDQERIARAKIVYDNAMQNPAVNGRAATEDYFRALGINDLERILPPPQPNQPDPIQMMQMQAMQTMSEAEMMKAQADMINAQAKMLDARAKIAKVDSEIQKLEAETLEKLSVVEKNERDLVLKELREEREFINDSINKTMELFRDARNRSAEDARNRTQNLSQERAVQTVTPSLGGGANDY